MENLRELVVEIDELQGKIDALNDTSKQTLDIDEVKIITSQVTRIKKSMRTLKEEGRKVYDGLAKEEEELLKDIKALKEVVKEEASEKYHKNKSDNYKRRQVKKLKPHGNKTGLKTKTVSRNHKDVDFCEVPDEILPENEGVFKIKTGKSENQNSGSCNTVRLSPVGGESGRCGTGLAVDMLPVEDNIAVTGTVQIEGKDPKKGRDVEKDVVLMPQFQTLWEAKDNTQFIKIYHKYQGEERRFEEWRRSFRHKTEEEIQEQSASYKLYLNEKESVKNKLSEWRNEKERQKREKDEAIIRDAQERESRKKEIVDVKEDRLQREREERFQKLAEWRKSKKNIIQQQQDPKPSEMLEVFTDTDSNFHPVQQERSRWFTARERKLIARQLDEYREWKKCQRESEMAKAQAEVEARKRLFNSQARTEFRKRDEAYLRKQNEWKKLEELQRKEQNKRLDKIKAQVKIEVESSKERLMQPTASHLASKLTAPPKGYMTVNVDNIPRLAVPEWRQGL